MGHFELSRVVGRVQFILHGFISAHPYFQIEYVEIESPVFQCVTSINTHTTAFQGQGHGYDQVVNILKQFYGQRSRMTYDFRSVQFNSYGDRTELSANAKIAPVLYETDMVLTVKQARELLGGGRRVKRKMSTNDR